MRCLTLTLYVACRVWPALLFQSIRNAARVCVEPIRLVCLCAHDWLIRVALWAQLSLLCNTNMCLVLCGCAGGLLQTLAHSNSLWQLQTDFSFYWYIENFPLSAILLSGTISVFDKYLWKYIYFIFMSRSTLKGTASFSLLSYGSKIVRLPFFPRKKGKMLDVDWKPQSLFSLHTLYFFPFSKGNDWECLGFGYCLNFIHSDFDSRFCLLILIRINLIPK